MIKILEKNRRPVVHFPAELESNNYVGEVYGFFHPDSNEYNVVSYGLKEQPQ